VKERDMPFVAAKDGTELFYRDLGRGHADVINPDILAFIKS
jgi:hypothetical protein